MKHRIIAPRLLRAIPIAILAIFSLGQTVPVQSAANTARVVKYGQNDIVTVHAKLRYSTLIVLPENEEILDFTTGDKDISYNRTSASHAAV